MKKKHVTVLSLAAIATILGLTGCNNADGPSSTTPAGVSTTTPTETTTTPNSTPTDTTPTGGEEEEPDDGIIDPSESPWSTEITSLMEEYLGGGILPFVDLGGPEIDAEFVQDDQYEDYRSYLLLSGGNFVPSSLTNAVDEYRDHQWDALTFSDTFYATNDTLRLEVEVSSDSSNLFELKAFYDEPFDNTTVNAWDTDTKTLISEHFGTLGSNIPFVYLGTTRFESSIDDDGALVVRGGQWNAAVLKEFKTAFADWTITEDPTSLETLTATKTTSGGTLTAVIQKVKNKIQLSVSLEETFNAANQTAWSSTVTAAMDRILNKVTLPYVYLGTTYPVYETSLSNERTLVLVGSLWDDSILEAAKTAFVADGWTDASTGEIASFTKENGKDSLEVVIEKNADGVPQLTATRSELYDDTLTSYPESITSAFEAKYGERMEDIVPFINLGTASPILDEELATEQGDQDKIVITGGSYDERTLDQFREKFTEKEDDGWYVTIDNVVSENSAENEGVALGVAIKAFEKYTYKIGLFCLGNEDEQTAYLEINRSKNDVPTDVTDWSEEAKANAKKVLGSDVEIPYFYTGWTTLEMQIDTDGILEFRFNADSTTFSTRVYSILKAFDDAGWDLTFAHNENYYRNEVWINSIKATKDFNGKKVRVEVNINSSSYYRFAMFSSLSLEEEYDATKVNGSWSDEIKNAVKDKFNIDLPFIYLGTDNPFLYEGLNSYDEEVFRIYGNAMGDNYEVFPNARKVLEENGFTIDDAESSSYFIVATKENSDQNLVTVKVDYTDDRPFLELSLSESFNPSHFSAWDDATKKVLDESLPEGVTLPYIYLGTGTPTATSEDNDFMTHITITGGEWNDQANSVFRNALEATGDDWTIGMGSTYSGSFLTAYKLFEDKTAFRLKLSESYSDEIQLDIYFDKKAEQASTGVISWEDLPKDYSGESAGFPEAMQTWLGAELPEFVPSELLAGDDAYGSLSQPWNTNQSRYASFSAYNAYVTPYYIYVAMDNLKAAGFEDVTLDPFAEGVFPGISAVKKEEKGTIRLQFTPAYGQFSNEFGGWKITALYLPSTDQFANVTGWNDSEKAKITGALDGLELPYVNLGSDTLSVAGSNGKVTINSYNYSDEILDDIVSTYKEAGWEMLKTYTISSGEVLPSIVGHLVADNGHTYVINVTVSLSSTSYMTKIAVTMA